MKKDPILVDLAKLRELVTGLDLSDPRSKEYIEARWLKLDALEQALWFRKETAGLIHHSDRGSQYLSIRYTERLAQENIDASVGSIGDSYDNALAETINGLYKTEGELCTARVIFRYG